MNKTSRKRPRRQNLYSRPRKTSTFKLLWPWLFQQLRPTTRPVFFFFGPKVKTCQRIRVKSYQNVGFRSSIDYTFWAQPFLVTTHSRFVFFKSNGQRCKDIPMSSDVLCEAPGEHTANSLQRKKKTVGFEGFWLITYAP